MPAGRLPPRLLPILYFGAAHASLALAFAAIAFDPRAVSGFFYHPRMLGIVHLVTLGWITSSILGALYLVGPIALRAWFPADAAGYTAFGLIAIGIIGMVAHFWLQAYAGMAWSAATVAAGLVIAGARILSWLRASPLPRAVAAHIVLAFANLAGAATLGVLIGFDKAYHFLGGFVLDNVFAHAHLAAVGWAAMMVVGVAYRLLPMILPAEMPAGRRLWTSAVLLETGVVGLVVSLLLRSQWAALFAVVIAAGFAAFGREVVWMIGRPRPRPPTLRQPDPAVLHAAASLVWLATAAVLGVWLSIAEPSPATLRATMAYGVFGLIGFLAQIVVGMEGRLLPLFAWYWEYANSGYTGAPPAPHQMPWRRAQYAVFALWLIGVPALAGGLALDAVPLVGAAAWCLLAATAIETANCVHIVRRAFVASAVPR
jgi:hypothetical protein